MAPLDQPTKPGCNLLGLTNVFCHGGDPGVLEVTPHKLQFSLNLCFQQKGSSSPVSMHFLGLTEHQLKQLASCNSGHNEKVDTGTTRH